MQPQDLREKETLQSGREEGKGLWDIVQPACILLALLQGFGRLIFGKWSDATGNAEGTGWDIDDSSVMHRGLENCREKDR